jgi:hypothetical protein
VFDRLKDYRRKKSRAAGEEPAKKISLEVRTPDVIITRECKVEEER